MAVPPNASYPYTPPQVQATPAYMPPRRLLFASNLSNSIGQRTLSRAEIDQAIRQHGTNIAVMVDVGGTTDMRTQAGQMLDYLRQRGVRHIGVYTEGRTGPTGSRYEAGELARKEAAKRRYGMSEAQWMNGGWERSFHDQVRHFARNCGATFFEADNIPEGQTVRFLRQFQAAKDRGELPPHVQMLMKNPVQGEINELRRALADGSVRRESIADFAISEEGYRSQWPALRRGLAEFGIQLANSHDTHQYAAKEDYDQNLLGALGRFVRGVGNAIGTVIGGVANGIATVANGIGTALGLVPAQPAPHPVPAHMRPHMAGHYPAPHYAHSNHVAQRQAQPVPPAIHPVSRHEPPSQGWRINAPAAPAAHSVPHAPRTEHPSGGWQVRPSAEVDQPPRQRPA